jgi:hypothetical protein
VSRRRRGLLGAAVVLAGLWVWVHSWEPDYRQAPVERSQPVRHEPAREAWPGWPGGIPEPPPGECDPPPGLRDGIYTCAYLSTEEPR